MESQADPEALQAPHILSQSPWAAITNYRGWGGDLDSRHLEAVKSKVMVPAESGPCGTPSWFADGSILAEPAHGGKRKLWSKGTNTTVSTPPSRLHLHNHLPKAAPPHIITLGIRVSAWEGWGGRDQLVFGSLQRKVRSSPHWSSPRQLLGRRTAWHCEERELPRGPCCPTSLSQVCAPRAGLTASVVFLGHVAWRPSPVVLPSCWGDEEYAHVGKKNLTQRHGR